MKMAYYPGCTLKTNAQNFETSTYAVAEKLGIELVEPERWNCCGTVHALAKDDVMHYLAPLRNLIRVDELYRKGKVDENRVVTLCAMCYNTLKRADIDAKADADKMKKIRDIMEREDIQYSGNVEINHFFEILKDLSWENVEEKVEKPLDGIRVAPYYGCLLLRPRGIGIDDTDNPTIMEDMIRSLGGEAVDYAYKQKCCGAYHTVHMREVAEDLSHRILRQVNEVGADLVITACPLCDYNLGSRQPGIKERYPGFESVPVVYFTQLIALAFGLEEKDVGFEGSFPDPRPLLKERGLL